MGLRRELRRLHLNGFALRFARRLFTRHPEWLELAASEPRSVRESDVFTLRVVFPSERAISPLILSVDEWPWLVRVTWAHVASRHRWEGDDWIHGLRPGERPGVATAVALDEVRETIEFDAAVERLDSFFAERIAAFAIEDGVRGIYGLGSPAEIDRRIAMEPGDAIVRSWQGALDRDVPGHGENGVSAPTFQ